MPVIFNKVQLDKFFPDGIDDIIFLGMANTLNYIGIDLSLANQKFEYWLKENQIIILINIRFYLRPCHFCC